MMVKVKDIATGRIKTIHFGQKGYKHNYNKEAYKNYMRRSAGIKDSYGMLTKNNPMSANYWSRKVLWDNKKWKTKKK